MSYAIIQCMLLHAQACKRSCLQGAAAYKAKVTFPEDKDILARTVIVGEMNPAVNLEQVSLITSCASLAIPFPCPMYALQSSDTVRFLP